MLRAFVRKFQGIGLDRAQNRLEYQRVLLVNTLTLIIQGFIIVLTAIVIGYQLWTHVFIGVLAFLLLKPTYYLNRIGRYNAAALYMVNFCVIGILAASYFAFFESRFSETENWLYAFIAISVFLFDGALMRFHFWLITAELLLAKVVKFVVLQLPMGQDFVLLLVNSIILCLGLFVFLLIFKFGLRRTLAKLEEADRMKNKLFSIVAHDLKSPFTLFEGMLTASKTDLISKDQFLDMQENLRKNFEPLKNTVTGLLEWSQVQLNNIKPHKETFDPRAAIEEVISAMFMLLESKSQNIRVQGDMGVIFTDRNHFMIIIRNILQNALKFSPKGSIVTVDMESTVIRISDQGDGMEKSKIVAILNNRLLVSSRGTEGEKGTGLGMNLTKELMDRNQISLDIQSTIGVGSTFVLTFTAQKENETPLSSN